MSNFTWITRHPVTGQLKIAEWMDDYFGLHKYGIKFKGDSKIYREKDVDVKKEKHEKA